MNQAFLIGLAMVSLSLASYWGLMKLEALKPQKRAKRRKAKKKRSPYSNKVWLFLKPVLQSTMKDLLLGIWYLAFFTWVYAAFIDDLALMLIASVPIFLINHYLRSLKKQN